MSSSFRHFSADEVGKGLSYARDRLGIVLDRDTLRALADSTGIRWYASGRKPTLLQQAKGEALNELWQRNQMDVARRNAYSSVVASMFSARRRRKPMQATKKIKRPDSTALDPTLFGTNDKGQGIFLFPRPN